MRRVEITIAGVDVEVLKAARRSELVRRHLDAARHHMQQASQFVELARRAAADLSADPMNLLAKRALCPYSSGGMFKCGLTEGHDGPHKTPRQIEREQNEQEMRLAAANARPATSSEQDDAAAEQLVARMRR